MTRYGFTVLNILLVAIAAYFCVDLFYQVVSAQLTQASLSDLSRTNPMPPEADYTRGSAVLRPKEKFFAYQTIVDRDLFKTKGMEKSEKALAQIELDKLEETSLNLKLWGTVTGTPDKPYAVIEETKTHKQNLYREGDSVSNAQIKMILRKKVVLNVNGKDEILLMEEKKRKTGSSLASGSRYEASTPFDIRGGDTINIDRTKINSALRNINQLMSQVKVRPYFKNGKPDGLMLSHIRQRSIFAEMGLKSGDIVKEVNGSEIKSVDDALKFYENLKSSPSVQLQIERRGEQKNIVYQID